MDNTIADPKKPMVFNLIMKLGSELADLNYQWPDDLKKEFELVVTSFDDYNILTVIYKIADHAYGCHMVGIGGCIKIIETPCLYSSEPCCSYTAIYEGGEEVQINDVVLATDQTLA